MGHCVQYVFFCLHNKPNMALQSSVKRDVEECKVAVRKLAESVTTVKNVLDRKIIDEIRRVRSQSVLFLAQ